MELRSGTKINAGYASAAEARAACFGQARTQLGDQHLPAFNAAVHGVLCRWTALRLAVENEWGGERSLDLANELEQSIISWFRQKGDHFPDELEDHLEDFLTEEFHVECEDGSPREVSLLLVHAFEACAAGDYALAAELSKPVALSPLEASQRDESDKRWTLQHDAARGSDAPRRRAEGMAEDDLAAMMSGMQTRGGGGAEEGDDGAGPAPPEEEEELEPLEDGWERVPTKKGGRRGGAGAVAGGGGRAGTRSSSAAAAAAAAAAQQQGAAGDGGGGGGGGDEMMA